jgi:hypothetical protein
MMSLFLQEVFPGFVLSDQIGILVPLFTSRNPNATVSNLALSKYNNSCDNSTLGQPKCEPGFAWDDKSGLCFLALNGSRNFWAASEACHGIGADLLGFDNDLKVQGLLAILNKGNKHDYCIVK